jgi:hypothetical protein
MVNKRNKILCLATIALILTLATGGCLKSPNQKAIDMVIF